MQQKKFALSLSFILLFIVFTFGNANAAHGASNQYVNYDKPIFVNGEYLNFSKDQQPVMDKKAGVVLVPIRLISEAFGANVSYNSYNKYIYIKTSTTTLGMYVGKKDISVNGKNKKLSYTPVLLNGRTMVPIRAIEHLNTTVNYTDSGTIFIETADYKDSIKGVLYTVPVKHARKTYNITLFVPNNLPISYELINLKHFAKTIGAKVSASEVYVPKSEAVYKNLTKHIDKVLAKKKSTYINAMFAVANLDKITDPTTALTVLATSTIPVNLPDGTSMFTGMKSTNMPSTDFAWYVKKYGSTELALDRWFYYYTKQEGLKAAAKVTKAGFQLQQSAFKIVRKSM